MQYQQYQSTAPGPDAGPRPRQIQHFGWTPDLPDHRDFLYAAPTPVLKNIPASVDLRPKCPPVYNPGELGSCTANAIAGAVEFDQMKESAKYPTPFVPSRLFIYYNERTIEGTVGQDSGAQLRDGIKSVASVGVCPEATDWPYDITKFTDAPPAQAFADASQYKVTSYLRLIQDLNTIKGCLASGYPFVFGFTAYDSIYQPNAARTGQIPMPTTQDSVVGGHAVMAVGYDDASRAFTIRNSWGTEWGAGGYGFLPYSYLLERTLAQDFWTIRST
ncbi:peptidase C1 [Gemmatimonadetes bacterium T265]|nr:peptidase C1 [Gemmatimonadetes bacterium T265]